MMTRKSVGLVLIGAFLAAAATAMALPVGKSLRHANASPRNGAPRVRVQVLNTTKTRGLARRAMLYLRDQGFDVVEVGTARPLVDTTLVLDRSRHPDWARSVATSLGAARVEARPDTSRYLDVTVLIGSSWRPPAQPFYP
jgi:LytR cell envelope-related transcriptional attenuator